MKRFILLLILFSCIYGCQHSKIEKDIFLGKWNNYPIKLNSEVLFYNDSVILFNYCNKSSGTWEVDKSKIYLHFQEAASNPYYKEYLTWNYKLNSFKDTLEVTIKNDSIKHLLFKVKNDWEHFNKSLGLNINLPTSNKKLIISDSILQHHNFYIAYNKNKLLINFNGSYETFELYNLNSNQFRIELFKNLVSKESEQFNLIIDKNVPEIQIDSLKFILNRELNKNLKFFRVYKNESANYGHMDSNCYLDKLWNWYGINEY